MTSTRKTIDPGVGFAPNIAEQVNTIRAAFDRGVTRPLAWRLQQLDALKAMLEDNQGELQDALAADLSKSPIEAWTTEIGFSSSDIEHQRRHLKQWMKPRRAPVPVMLRPGHGKVHPEPKGVALIMAPWNYPVQLLVSPMAAAISAGNAVVAKPSELAPATSATLVDLAARYLDTDAIAVLGGGVDVATELLEERFDHIFFTGGAKVGTIVMQAAAKHLTPVTLELGGKSPAIVSADANIEIAARRIVWGKFINAGQTCVAPDYVLAASAISDQLVEEIETTIEAFYGTDPQSSPDYGRIINLGHLHRLEALLAGHGSGTVATGGQIDAEDRYVAPTVLTDPEPDSAIMSEEIFGPLLPVLSVDSVDDAIGFINSRPKPLALYVFASDDDTIDTVVARTSSGGVAVNTTLMHLAAPELPFGGIGASGIGAYHGKAGFETFSHLKSVYTRPVRPDLSVLYPPYSRLAERVLRRSS